MTPARTHDLLRLRPRASLILDAPAPPWVAAFLMETPWVIVRGEIRNDVIPVRVRGPAREQYFDARISTSAVAYRSTPEDLAGRRCAFLACLFVGVFVTPVANRLRLPYAA